MFQPIKALINKTCPEFATKDKDKIPNCATLNQLFQYTNDSEQELQFVVQNDSLEYSEIGYELRIFQHGLIATREKNWHDYFNALIWLKFPQTKSAINTVHYQEIQQQTSNHRSRRRDLLTLFDECGIIIQANNNIQQLIKQHQWQELFIEHKDMWLDGSIKVETFGHAMYEKYLEPYIGMTAKALLLPTEINDVDCFLAHNLNNQQLLISKTELSPLPVLGIPNWHKNQTSRFYANTQYFR
ncbi:MAG: DUF3025 domain-containing protein [Proteobacteria bacterium]|nr:DUF3025 domain-containing protein [Pseudomonadota bacterium]